MEESKRDLLTSVYVVAMIILWTVLWSRYMGVLAFDKQIDPQIVTNKDVSPAMLTGDIVWREDVFLTGDFTIPENTTLTIKPGVTVYFAANQDDQAAGFWEDRAELHVFGTLIAKGTAVSPITFVSDAKLPEAGAWGGIIIRKNSTESILSYCVVRGAEHGIRFYMNHEGAGQISGAVTECAITNNTVGVFMQGSPRYDSNGGKVLVNPTITDNVIADNVEDGIFIRTVTGYGRSQNEALIQANQIHNNGTGIRLKSNSWWLGHTTTRPRILNNVIEDNVNFGIHISASGSGDTSGSDTSVTPVISYNRLQNNGEAHIQLLLDPQGGDGKQVLAPTIRCNTVLGPTAGIFLADTGSGGQLQPVITHNYFADFTTVANGLIHRAGLREFEMYNNYWELSELEEQSLFCQDTAVSSK